MGSYCTAQKTMSGLLGWNMMEDSLKKRMCVCVCVCVCVALHFTTEIEETLQINYSLIKKKKIIKVHYGSETFNF